MLAISGLRPCMQKGLPLDCNLKNYHGHLIGALHNGRYKSSMCRMLIDLISDALCQNSNSSRNTLLSRHDHAHGLQCA